MPLLHSEPVLALRYDQLNSGEVGTEAGHVTRKECQAFCGRVSADVKVWQRRPSLAAASTILDETPCRKKAGFIRER